MSYVPAHIGQFDGTSCESTNCWACVSAWLLNAATRGRVDLTPAQVRRQVGASHCRTGGIGDAQHLLQRHHKRSVMHMDVDREHGRRLFDKAGSMFGFHTDYDVLTDRPDTGVFHSIAVVGGIENGEVRVMDPAREHIRRLPVSLLLDAAIAYGRQHGNGATFDAIEVKVPAR